MAKARIAIPDNLNAGDVVEIKTLITHPMESGFRVDARGERIPRNILTRFECEYSGKIVFSADLRPGLAANPYLSFFVRIEGSGPMVFSWAGQEDFYFREERDIRVVG